MSRLPLSASPPIGLNYLPKVRVLCYSMLFWVVRELNFFAAFFNVLDKSRLFDKPKASLVIFSFLARNISFKVKAFYWLVSSRLLEAVRENSWSKSGVHCFISCKTEEKEADLCCCSVSYYDTFASLSSILISFFSAGDDVTRTSSYYSFFGVGPL